VTVTHRCRSSFHVILSVSEGSSLGKTVAPSGYRHIGRRSFAPLRMTLVVMLMLASASPALAQHHGGHHGDHDGAHAADTLAVPTGLTAEEVTGLLEGQGMGMAWPAELHGYPGPLHVLELADALDLTP